MALILRVDFCRSEIKIFVRKRKLKPPHGGGFPTDEPVQGGDKRKRGVGSWIIFKR